MRSLDRYSARAACSGKTLMELIMALGINAFAMVLAGNGYLLISNTFRINREIVSSQLELTEAFLELEHDIKNAGHDPLQSGLDDHLAAEVVPPGEPLTGGLRLYGDITGSAGVPDGDCDDPGETIVYALDTATGILNRHVRGENGAWVIDPILTSVSVFVPTLLDASGAPAPAASATDVQLTLGVRIRGTTWWSNPTERQQTFQIVLRNRLLSEE